MTKTSLTNDDLQTYLRDVGGTCIERVFVKGIQYAQIVIPAKGNKPQKLRTIRIDDE